MMNYPRPGVGALRGSPALSPEQQRMRDWALSQRTATAEQAYNPGGFISRTGGSQPPGIVPTSMPSGGMPGTMGGTGGANPGAPGAGMGAPKPDPVSNGPMPPMKPGTLPVKPDMPPPPPNKAGRLTGRRG